MTDIDIKVISEKANKRLKVIAADYLENQDINDVAADIYASMVFAYLAGLNPLVLLYSARTAAVAMQDIASEDFKNKLN